MAEVAGDDQEVELQKYSDSKRREIEYKDKSEQREKSEAVVPENSLPRVKWSQRNQMI